MMMESSTTTAVADENSAMLSNLEQPMSSITGANNNDSRAPINPEKSVKSNNSKSELRSATMAPPSIISPELMDLQPTINIGMIGHVAHGKSTLTKALSTVSTGKHRDEKKANMTIKLGYANVKIFKCDSKLCPRPWCYSAFGSDQTRDPPPICTRPGCKSPMSLVRHFSLVDAPGHSSLMTTMLSGASVMDSCMLVVAANEDCPCPQTAEHLVAAEALGVSKNCLVVQNKLDLVDPQRAIDHLLQIGRFLEGSSAAASPVIPVCAQSGLNVDILCQYLVEKLPIPKRDLESAARMYLVRSFDVNKPGHVVKKLQGAVVGGSLVQGVVHTGMDVEIRPGLVRADGSYHPLITHITSLFSEKQALQRAVPGGLVAVGLALDPALAKGDRLVGQILGRKGTLPPVVIGVSIEYRLLRTLVGEAAQRKTEDEDPDVARITRKGKKKPKKPHRPRAGEQLLVCLAASKTTATVVSSKKQHMELTLRTPVCCPASARVAIFRRSNGRWRLLGSGFVMAHTEATLLDPSTLDAELPSASPKCIDHERVERRDSVSNSSSSESDTDPVSASASASADERAAKRQFLLGLMGASPAGAEQNDETTAPELRNDKRKKKKAGQGREFQNNCRLQPNELPALGDVVMGQIVRIDTQVGAHCRLLEYEHGDDDSANVDALLIAAEVSKRRLRSIAQRLKEGKREVLEVTAVDVLSRHVDLSLKRVSNEERTLCKRRFARLQTLQSLAWCVARECSLSVPQVYTHILWPLQRHAQALCPEQPSNTSVDEGASGKEGTVKGSTDALDLLANAVQHGRQEQATSHDDDPIDFLCLPAWVHSSLLRATARRLTKVATVAQARVVATCFGPSGAGIIRAAFALISVAAKEDGLTLRATIQTAPVYVLSLKGRSPSLLQALQRLCSLLKGHLQCHGGNLALQDRMRLLVA